VQSAQDFAKQHAVLTLPVVPFDDWNTVDNLFGVLSGKAHAAMERDGAFIER
jgi:hypothetical protein